MNQSFELFVALRYLLAGRKQAFISLISLISVIGVAVGVMANLIALALMTGLQTELRDRIIGSAAHVYVFKVGGIEDPAAESRSFAKSRGSLGPSAVVLGKGLITSPQGEAFIELKGIDPETEKTVTRLERAIESGSMAGLTSADGPPGVLIGRDLARTLEVSAGRCRRGDDAGRHDQHAVRSDVAAAGAASRRHLQPGPLRVRLELRLRVATRGDAAAGQGPSRLHRAPRRRHVQGARKSSIASSSATAPSTMPQDWADLNKNLFSALWLEKMAISIAIGLIVMVAALNIVASLILLVMEKSSDIAILKTMGASAASIRRIFMLQGLIIGLLGTTAGAAGGCALIYVLDRYKLIQVPIDVYQISYMPFTLLPRDFIVVVSAAVLICLVATIYPSRLAAKLDPAVALRYQ